MQHTDNIKKLEIVNESTKAHSPFLARLLSIYPDFIAHIGEQGIDKVYSEFTAAFIQLANIEHDQAGLMRDLRIAKGKLALLTALADISGYWSLEQITGALSDFAQECLVTIIKHLLVSAKKRGEIENDMTDKSGIIILGMGKLGGRELNYSSDIDLIILYEPEKLGYKGRNNEQKFMNKLAQDIVFIMQERTADGYVFRTDLRLRPDPASTPPAVSVDAAYYYYEGVGQNWERAAMIKARPMAGDIEAGEKFLKSLTPFMWRRNLDFAAINDIHSIKRQMDSRQSREITVKGHNIKLGLGGIREIEFYTQIHQLIWGGREGKLRLRSTCETLEVLTKMGLITPEKNNILQSAYVFLRTLEHRIQMVNDEQTHTLPEDDKEIKNIAEFMGYDHVDLFSEDLLKHLNAVHEIYASSFRGTEKLGDTGNLVFTGVSHDEETLKTVRSMGYEQPEVISEIIMGWHHGSCRATRTKRARELLTEMMPAILKRLAETIHPDNAFLKFNEFLKKLPASTQIFSLFQMNPTLLGLIADIMGSAPTLATTLSNMPELLDAVLYHDFYQKLPTQEMLQEQLKETLRHEEFFDERMDKLRQFRNEKQFQAGVQFLKHMINVRQTEAFISELAELMLRETLALVTADFEKTYGKISGSRFAIIALGKLGSKEMTFSSDIDLVFVYTTPDFEALSDGEKQFTASVYYNRLAQRLLSALSGMGRDGRLYEVDTRLRPSGAQGLLAVSAQALSHYFDELAWTFEFMAFTKARVVAGDESLASELDAFISQQICKKRDLEKLRADVVDMRERIATSHVTENPWDIKYIRGGLTDIDFIAQYLLLRFAPELEECKSCAARDVFEVLKKHACMDAKMLDRLNSAQQFLDQLFNMLRLCVSHQFDETTAPEGLKKLLVETVKEKDFTTLNQRLLEVEKMVCVNYEKVLA